MNSNINQFKQISYLMIEVNSFCNLDCAFCNRKQLEDLGLREQKTLSVEEFRTVLEKFKDCNIDTIKLEGLSEPMFHPQFDECAKLLKEYFPKAFVIIATNLQYNIEKTPFKKTLEYIDMCYLSIDGIGEVYEKARSGSRYDKLLKNLDWIKENIDLKIRLDKLHINHVSTKENYHQISEIYDLKEKYSLASVRINLAQNWNEHELNPNQFESDYVRELRKYKKDVKGVPGWEFKDCFWPYEGLIVDVFGDARQCIINTSQKSLFNIYQDDFEDFFNNSHFYKETRKTLEKNCPPDACVNCDYNYLSRTLNEIQEDEAISIKPREFKRC